MESWNISFINFKTAYDRWHPDNKARGHDPSCGYCIAVKSCYDCYLFHERACGETATHISKIETSWGKWNYNTRVGELAEAKTYADKLFKIIVNHGKSLKYIDEEGNIVEPQ